VADSNAIQRIRDNPFFVLELRPDATRSEIERQGAKLLGMLELSLKSVATYPTPLGPSERTSDKVRQAMAELRDPERRLGHELWARLSPASKAEENDETHDLEELDETPPARADAPWPEAALALGWRRP